jgi:hypothetical protein
VVDGLVALPMSARTREQLEWLAGEVVDAGGEAWTWLARSGSVEQDDVLVGRLTDAAVEDYRTLLEAIDDLAGDSPTRRTVERLRRELHRIEARDHTGPPEREQARRAVEALAATAAREPAGVER